jgi:hypothetical protein
MWAHARERIGARSPDSRYSARSEATAEPQAMRILADEGVAVTLASGLATGLVNARASTLGRVKLAKWELTSGRITGGLTTMRLATHPAQEVDNRLRCQHQST